MSNRGRERASPASQWDSQPGVRTIPPTLRVHSREAGPDRSSEVFHTEKIIPKQATSQQVG